MLNLINLQLSAQTYASQFRELQVQLGSIKSEKINGVSLFSSDSSTSMTVYTSTNGSGGASVTLDNLDYSAGVSLSTGMLVETWVQRPQQGASARWHNSNTRYKCCNQCKPS